LKWSYKKINISFKVNEKEGGQDLSVKGNKKFILLGITVLTITILYGIYNFIKIQLVPITDFSLKQERSQQEGFSKSTIILNNQPYICDYEEFCLVTLNTRPFLGQYYDSCWLLGSSGVYFLNTLFII